MGSFGVFFAEFEAKFPSGKEWDVRDAMIEIQGFRQSVVTAIEGGGGWEGEEDAERGVAVRTVVNSLLLTRLWTDSLQAAYALANSRQDDIIGKGLPAFDPDRCLCFFRHSWLRGSLGARQGVNSCLGYRV